MLSSEITDLESFIDSYVMPDKMSNSPRNWSRTQMNEEGFPATSHFAEQPNMAHNTGTELWGQKPGGQEWHASAKVNSHQEWNEYRPKIQERSIQWQPQAIQEPHPGYPPQYESHQYMQENPPGQNPNQIQAIVSDLIKQNNMTKVDNLPPWVDVTRPPPPFPNTMAPSFDSYPSSEAQNIFYDPNDNRFQGQEPILQSMTFQRADIPFSNQASVNMPNFSSNEHLQSWPVKDFVQNPSTFSSSPAQHWANNDPQLYNARPPMAMPNQQQYYEGQEQLDFHSEIMRGGHFESSENDGKKLEPPINTTETGPLYAKQLHQPNSHPVNNSSTSDQLQTSSHARKGSHPSNSSNPTKAKYPNSKFRSSRGSSGDEPVENFNEGPQRRTTQRQGSEEVFENERDEQWKTQNIQVQINNKKKTVRRKSSAADDDTNWRRREESDDVEHSKDKKRYSRHSSFEKGEPKGKKFEHSRSRTREHREERALPRGDEKAAPPSDSNRRLPGSKFSDADSEGQQRRLADRGKGTVVSWIQNDQRAADSMGKEIRRLRITDSETDLTKFIEVTQSFATTEAKMREIAEIICNKALNDTRSCRNAAILCDRMSFMMVHGTKFRSVVLNVMQGHYRNREQLYASSFRRDRRWFGFITFLVEIFLNVRTSTRERLLVLITPVFSSLFQVLTGDKIDKEHIECFGRLFELVGPALESEKPSRMNELVAEIRDRCVISTSSPVKRVLLHCVEQYASKWKMNSS